MPLAAAGSQPSRAARVLLAILAWMIAVVCIGAGIGLLYRLRSAGALKLGPLVAGALPLQQLAGGESQPLLRMAVAWVPVGLIGGLSLALLTRLAPLTRTAIFAVLAALLLLIAGAVSDAAAISDPLGPHLAPQLSRAGTWVAVALLLAGALLAVPLAARTRAWLSPQSAPG